MFTFGNGRASNPEHEICGCSICMCTCSASFRRDQLLSIHTAKHFEQYESSGSSKKNCTPAAAASMQHQSSTKHSVIREITSAITEHAKDAIVEVIQGSPLKVSKESSDTPDRQGVQFQRAIENSLGVTALSLAKDPMVAGNIFLKNELREEMGGAPSTILSSTQETVAQFRSNKMKGHSDKKKCARASRNDLVDLCSSDEENEKHMNKTRKAKMKNRILLNMLKKYKAATDVNEKVTIKKTMKDLDGNKSDSKNEMIHFIFDVHTIDLDSFDSTEATESILDFADDKDE